MTGIFPDNQGVPPVSTVRAYTPANEPLGCEPLYFDTSCTTVLTAEVMNSIISEIVAAVDKLGFAWNCDSITNLGDALSQMFTQVNSDIINIQNAITAINQRIDDLTADDIEVSPPISGYSNLQDLLVYINSNLGGGGGGIPDAPNDGAIYGRQNLAWVDLSTEFLNNAALAAALSAYQPLSGKGAANGYAPLDGDQWVPLVNMNPALVVQGDLADYINRDGSVSMAGIFDMGSNRIENLADAVLSNPGDAVNVATLNAVIATNTLYQGNYEVNANTPDLSNTASNVNGMTWTAVTVDPDVPEPTTVALPGVPLGTVLNNGDRLFWIAGISEYQIVRSGGLDLATGDMRYLQRDGSQPMLGELNAGGFRVINASAAVQPTDLTTLQQVQAMVAGGGAVSQATVAQIRSGATGVYMSPGRVRDAAAPIPATGVSGAVAPLLGGGINFSYELSGPTNFTAPASYPVGQSGVFIIRNQGFPVTFSSEYLFLPSSPTFSAVPGKVGLVAYYVEASGVIVCTAVIEQ